jgi:hypothetical protein
MTSSLAAFAINDNNISNKHRQIFIRGSHLRESRMIFGLQNDVKPDTSYLGVGLFSINSARINGQVQSDQATRISLLCPQRLSFASRFKSGMAWLRRQLAVCST